MAEFAAHQRREVMIKNRSPSISDSEFSSPRGDMSAGNTPAYLPGDTSPRSTEDARGSQLEREKEPASEGTVTADSQHDVKTTSKAAVSPEQSEPPEAGSGHAHSEPALCVCESDDIETAWYGSSRQCYHANTRPEDGSMALLIDPGSVGNLCGDRWAEELSRKAREHGFQGKFRRRAKPLRVSGVGAGSQQCINEYSLPIALFKGDASSATKSVYEAPGVMNSDLPGLLGLASLRRLRAILDLDNMKLHLV